MGRKVTVGLEADVAGFIRPVEAAKKSLSDLDDKIDATDRSLNKIPPDALKAGAALKLLGGDVDSVGDKISSLGEKNTGLAVLDAKIRAARVEVKKLAEEFIKTGDVDVFKKLGDAEGKLQSLQNVRKKLAATVVDGVEDAAKEIPKVLAKAGADGATEFGKIFTGGIQGVLSTPVLGPMIAGAVIAALAAAAPLILAAAGGAILGAAGVGAVGLGIMGAVMGDPKGVGGAWSAEFDKLKDDWLAGSTVFRGPLIDAAHEFGGVLANIHLDVILARAAGYLPPLVAGAAAAARYLGGAFESAVNDAGPVIAVLANELPKIGFSIQMAMVAIGSGGKGGAKALEDLLQFTERAIIALGALVGAAGQVYDKLASFRDWALPRDLLFTPDAPQKLLTGARAIDEVGHSAMMSSEELESLSSTLNKTAVTADSLAGAMVGKIFAATMGLDQAVLGVAESLVRLDETMDQNGRAIDKHTGLIATNTEKGIANREGVLAAVTANMSLYQAQLAAGMGAEEAAKHYEENTAALERQLRKAGLTGAQIDDLIGKYRGIPAKVNTEIAINGLTDAINNLATLIRQINGIHDKTVTISYKQYGSPQGQSRLSPERYGGIVRAADGMIVPPSNPGTVLFGEPETGGELYLPLRGIPRMRAAGLMNAAASGYGLAVGPTGGGHAEQTLRVVVQYPDGRVIRDQVIDWNASRGRRDPATFFLP